MKQVFCLGLTPVLQRTLIFDQLTLNEVNRAREVSLSAAGKAVNTARTLVALGTPAVVAGLNGGATGALVSEQIQAWGVADQMTAMKQPTRICTTLLDCRRSTVTELVEEAPNPGTPALKKFFAACVQQIPLSAYLVISGTLPSFVADDFYVRFVRKAKQASVPVVIDSHRAPLITVLFEQPLLAKLNAAELARTLDEPMNTEKRILRGMRDLIGMGAQNVCITQGAKTTYLMSAQGHWSIDPPTIRSCVNPIGSGDCTTAAIVHALLTGYPLPEAVRYGVACGSANAETQTPAEIRVTRIKTLLRQTRLTCHPARLPAKRR